MRFSPDWLRQRLEGLGAGDAGRLVVALSGGLDSTALLHALCRSGSESQILAIHINHQLHADADRWQAHCETVCRRLDVELEAIPVDVDRASPRGPEAAAREARYAAIIERLREGDMLLSAHHRDDQAETLLLNLMRASGPLGLSGIPQSRRLGAGRLLRPLLDVPHSELRQYAENEKLDWIDDPSNTETALDRNFLRHEVLPVMQQRWPSATRGLARSADLLAEASGLLDELAVTDLAGCDPARLPIDRLADLGDARSRNLIRYAVRQQGLPPPPSTALQRILDELLPARADAQPLVVWSGAEARRYRNELFLMAPQAPDPVPGGSLAPGGELDLGPLGRLRAEGGASRGVSPALADKGFCVRFRVGGEALQTERADHRHSLKHLLQEAGVLPWMRSRVPLLYCDDQLVAVGDLWVEQSVVAEPGVAIRWENRPAIT